MSFSSGSYYNMDREVLLSMYGASCNGLGGMVAEVTVAVIA